ncbi:MAG: GYF domain-containing protein [Gemmataceae bacterium]|nr:GYF domain-containing protein [Gemmataceae bacterium]MDW8244885.1 GYF domain-containing protein [Thermogemmata sp.]
MATQWFVNRNGNQEGPLTSAQLKQLVDRGELRPNDLVWKEGMSNWVPARQIKGLFPSSGEAVVEAAPASSPPAYTVVADTGAPHVAGSPGPQAYATTHASPTSQYYEPSSEEAFPRPFRNKKRRRSSDQWFYDFLTFRRMIAPILIQIMFWMGTVVWVIFGVYLFVDGLIPKDRLVDGLIPKDRHPEFAPNIERDFMRDFQDDLTNRAKNIGLRPKNNDSIKNNDNSKQSDFRQSLFGLFMIIFMPFVWRLVCEELIVFFQINETLTDIRNALERG